MEEDSNIGVCGRRQEVHHEVLDRGCRPVAQVRSWMKETVHRARPHGSEDPDVSKQRRVCPAVGRARQHEATEVCDVLAARTRLSLRREVGPWT